MGDGEGAQKAPKLEVLHTVRCLGCGAVYSKTRSTGGADRQLQAVVSQDDTRSHHAAHPLTRLERPAEEIGLAQHAVQVQVETGNVVARAEPEAGGQDAGVSLGVDDGDVRRVAGSVGRLAVEHLREDDGALGFSEPS